MHRYFVKEFDGTHFYLRDDNFHHAKNVVRLKLNTNVICIYNEQSFSGVVAEINDNFVLVKKEQLLPETKKNYRVTLILGLIREQKWDFVLQKATELGVDAIVPALFRRSVVQISQDKELSKIRRWEKICEDASEQSHKITIPKIEKIARTMNDLKKYMSDVNICCYENGEEKKLETFYNQKKSFTFIIDPEGGFEAKEVETLKNMGFYNLKFSKNILRAETVPLYLLSTLMFYFG